MVDPTAPDTAWPNGGSLYSSKLTIFFSSMKRHRKKEGKKYKNEKKKNLSNHHMRLYDVKLQ